MPAANSVAAKIAPPTLKGLYMGTNGMVFGLAFLVAPLLGGLVLDRFGKVILWTACAAVLLVGSIGRVKKRDQHQSPRRSIVNRREPDPVK